MIAALRLSLLGAFLSLPLLAAMPDAPRHDPKPLLALAKVAETAKQYDKALELYLKAYLAGERTTEVRERIHDCLRLAAQSKRHRDPAFRQYVLSLPPAEALNLYAEIVEKLSTHHADREKSKPERLFLSSLEEIERSLEDKAFRKQYLTGSDAKLSKFLKSTRDYWRERLPTTAREARVALQELIRSAQAELSIKEPTALVLEAICGACSGLDESTVWLPPGAEPAKNLEPTIGRAEIVNPIAGVGLIEIKRFRDTTPAEFEQALARLKDEGLRSLVIDLRGNGGGSLPAALQLTERFVPAGVLARTDGQVPEFNERVFSSTSGMTAITLPLIVLVDGKTMSAAEVFASALKEHGRATLVGTETFGKGSVQSPIPLSGSDSATPRPGKLIVTIAKVLTAKGTPLSGAGVTPHITEREPHLQLRVASERAAEMTGGM